jgi:hypothetical protein
MKFSIKDWITYILNILLAIPFCGIAAAWIVGIIYFGLFKCIPSANTSYTYIAGALALGMTVFWSIYQYRIIIRKQPRPKAENKISCLVFCIFILCIFFGIWGVAHWRTEFHINAETYQDFTARFRSAKRLSIARELVPEGSTSIDFFEHDKSFSRYMLVRCICGEDELQKFASERGYAFTPKQYAISSAWQHFNPEDTELKTVPEKCLVYEDRHPNGSGFHFLYDVDRKILYSKWSNR